MAWPAFILCTASFAMRWQVLDANETQAPGVCLGLRRAWAGRRNWPAFDDMHLDRYLVAWRGVRVVDAVYGPGSPGGVGQERPSRHASGTAAKVRLRCGAAALTEGITSLA